MPLSHLILSILLSISDITSHAVYISVIELYKSEIKVKVFADDMRDAIRNENENFKLTDEESFCQQNKESILKYFQDKLDVVVNGHKVGFEYKDAKLVGDSYWIRFLYADQGKWESISIINSHFMELFPTQTTIVKLVGEKQDFCKITIDHPKCQFIF